MQVLPLSENSPARGMGWEVPGCVYSSSSSSSSFPLGGSKCWTQRGSLRPWRGPGLLCFLSPSADNQRSCDGGNNQAISDGRGLWPSSSSPEKFFVEEYFFPEEPSCFPAVWSGISHGPMAFLTCNESFTGGLLQIHIGGSTKVFFFLSYMAVASSHFLIVLWLETLILWQVVYGMFFKPCIFWLLGYSLLCDFMKLLKNCF